MGQREYFWPMVSPISDGVSQSVIRISGEVVSEGILADDQCKPNLRQVLEQITSPSKGTFGTGRMISGLASAWVAETHREYGNPASVVENISGHSQPLTQSIAAGVVERHSGLVDFPAWRLPRN